MLDVAREFNLSETAFALKLPLGKEADWAVRWFTPMVEDDLCGHATLATAHALHADNPWPGVIRFGTRSGVLVAKLSRGWITLDFPSAPATRIPVPVGLGQALGAEPDATYETGPLRDLLTVFATEDTVRALAPNFQSLSTLTRRDGIRGITATAAASTRNFLYDFVSRFFSPADGIPEDPVTGSAHTALAPFWSQRLGRKRLTGLQVSSRPGHVRTEVRGDRVFLMGQAVTVWEGILSDSAEPGWTAV